ncbi:PREDICTED: MDIS1-interacting receptor like kinase 2-like [Ipomoea nil]|uniref:MDIS1-interacting receptor like kinase 2-like n=1 Tax=Ipomoea nil TaxID=35883 RepID=UPI000900D7F6|nr:PREDICTED: MDIS1-interacting receptor like kinase 2-like [Ipomoea nil]
MNNLSGTIPNQISDLTRLIYLDLSINTNQFSGAIPRDMRFLTNFRTLHLFDNKLNGSIPGEIGQLLALYSNNLEGPIPISLANFTNLTSLFLYEIGSLVLSLQKSGIFSTSWSFTQIQTDLPATFGNRLSGSIPQEVGNLRGLYDLELSMNWLGGPIPAAIGNLSKLAVLFLRPRR